MNNLQWTTLGKVVHSRLRSARPYLKNTGRETNNTRIMSISEKYARTFHYPFSPGVTSDDRINYNYWNDIQHINQLVHTEKLDGENNCLNKYGVFARSHAAPAVSPWTSTLRQHWQMVKNDLGDLEIFLENCYATHSLRYQNLPFHFFVFAIRDNDTWLSWEETKFFASLIDLAVVPEISFENTPEDKTGYEQLIIKLSGGAGSFCPVDIHSGQPATMEGIVTRNTASYKKESFARNVFKYVRKGHVKTDAHWTRNWKRASLQSEGGHHVEDIKT